MSTINFDNANSSNGSASGLTYSLNIGTQSNRVLIVGVACDSNANVTSLKAAGGNLTQVGKSSIGALAAELWYLIAPQTGTVTIQIVLSALANVCSGAVSYYNCAQNVQFRNSNSASGNTNRILGSTTCTQNSLIVDCGAVLGNPSITPGTGMTQEWIDGVGATIQGVGGDKVCGTTTPIASGYNLGAVANWAYVTGELLPILPPINGLSMMGMGT